MGILSSQCGRKDLCHSLRHLFWQMCHEVTCALFSSATPIPLCCSGCCSAFFYLPACCSAFCFLPYLLLFSLLFPLSAIWHDTNCMCHLWPICTAWPHLKRRTDSFHCVCIVFTPNITNGYVPLVKYRTDFTPQQNETIRNVSNWERNQNVWFNN